MVLAYFSSLLIVYEGCEHSEKVLQANLDLQNEDSSEPQPSTSSYTSKEDRRTLTASSYAGKEDRTTSALNSDGEEDDNTGRAGGAASYDESSSSSFEDSGGHHSSVNCVKCGRDIDISEPMTDVRMIDFAHTTYDGSMFASALHSGPDRGYIQGLTSVYTVLMDLLSNDSASSTS